MYSLNKIAVHARIALAILVLIALAAAIALFVRPAHADLMAANNGPIYYDLMPPGSSDGSSPYTLGAKWDRTTITYSIRNCPRSLDCAVAHQATREAVEVWDPVSGITLNEVTGEADINIYWYAGNHGDGNSFDGPGGILAHAYLPISWLGAIAGDAHFDDDEVWVAWAPGTPWDLHLQTVVSHEIGHSLGLDHSNDPTALMWAQYVGVRGISGDDIAGMQALYGGPNADDSAPAPTTTSGASNDGTGPSGVNATATTTIKIRSGPSTSYQQVGTFQYKGVAQIYGKNAAGTWLYIQYNGVRGWVAGQYCKLDGGMDRIPVVGDTPGGPTPTPMPELPPTGVSATTTSPTRMRSGPGTNFGQVATIPWGDTVPVFARNAAGDWVYVQWGGQRGWIAAWLVKINGDLNTVPVQ